MPSSPGYVRDYKQERKTAIRRGEVLGSDSPNAKRKRLRRQMEKEGKVRKHDGKDVDHKKPLSKGGSNSKANARVVDASSNRSFPRNSDGSIKSKPTKRNKK
jgi:5-methylcytosine-specific restriction endonuclease McrA